MSANTMRLPPMLSVDETARNLNVSTKTVRRLIARGELPAHRLGSFLRISQEEDLDDPTSYRDIGLCVLECRRPTVTTVLMASVTASGLSS